MKLNLDIYRDRGKCLSLHEVGWSSQQSCVIPMCDADAWYVGPLHYNQGNPVLGCAHKLRYVVSSEPRGEAWLESMVVLVYSESDTLLAQLNLPNLSVEGRPRELDIQNLQLPAQCKFRQLFKPTHFDRVVMSSANRLIDSWLAVAT